MSKLVGSVPGEALAVFRRAVNVHFGRRREFRKLAVLERDGKAWLIADSDVSAEFLGQAEVFVGAFEWAWGFREFTVAHPRMKFKKAVQQFSTERCRVASLC